jgi:hypothetical protein
MVGLRGTVTMTAQDQDDVIRQAKEHAARHGIPLGLMVGVTTVDERPAWPAATAFDVLRWMHRQRWAVLSVELWRAPREGGDAHRLAASEYDSARHGATWPDYVEHCTEGARTFIRYYANEPEAVFTLEWREPDT